ncbi:MAG: hypothetical protein M3384_19280 [Acidobacteriota bacterium]|nr:hypothetical protein [Acidobacteriota bacterium]
MSESGTEKEKRNVHRSPQFPILDLEDALGKTDIIFKNDRRAFTTAEAILSHLGYENAKRAGYHGRIIAALKHFGFLDEEANKLRVSETAFKILHLPEESEERNQLLKEAALLPNSFKKLWDFFNGEIPSDKTLESHLIITEKFNPDSVEKFIKVFRQTVIFAKLNGETVNGQTNLENETSLVKSESPEAKENDSNTKLNSGNSSEYELKNDETMMRFPISRTSEARVIFTGQVTQEAIRKLRTLLENIEDIYPTKEEIENEKNSSASLFKG